MSAVMTRKEVMSYPWKEVGSVTTAQARLSALKLAQAVAEALTSTGIMVFNVEKGASAIELRFRGSTNNLAEVVNIYGLRTGEDGADAQSIARMAATGDYYRLLATLTVTIGNAYASSATDRFVDTIVAGSNLGVEAGRANSDANDGMGSYVLKLGGHNRILIIATTLGGTQLAVDAARVDV